MIMEWSLCQCCGQSAKQRKIWTRKYHPSLDGSPRGRLYEAAEPQLLLPDLCDHCYKDITSHFTGDDVWLEIERREEKFKNNFVVVGFEPIIEPTAAAISYQI